MSRMKSQPFITTIRDRCRVCFTCVRECPAKAIRIADGQAEVIAERCIGCGNCVRVCSQKAKRVLSSIDMVEGLLKSGDQVIACIAPSFPVDFGEMPVEIFAGMIRALGFHQVVEVGFGADLVADKMRRLIESSEGKKWISTACPAVFGYVKRYHPDLIDALAPVVSPMIATARVMREKHGPDIKVVFIGPCISKKIEASSEEVSGEVDAVLTFTELRKMFETRHLKPDEMIPVDFDPPHARKGSLFPIGRGLLEAADIREDLIEGDVISANGKATFIDAVMEFSAGEIDAGFLDVLCCDGCIMGSGLSTEAPPFKRRMLVGKYVRDVMKNRDAESHHREKEHFQTIDLTREFLPFDQRIPVPEEMTIREILARMGKHETADELNCGACGYETCRDHAIAIHKGLAESEMCLPYTIEKLHKTIFELNDSNTQLADVREALIQSEKMASMGQLAAGIAHEVNNPLGVVLMYAHILLEEMSSQKSVSDDLRMIVDHADRAKKIVSDLLHFARQNKVDLKPITVCEFINHALRSIQYPETVGISVRHEHPEETVMLDLDQMIQVMSNLVQNAVSAMNGIGEIEIATESAGEQIKISISDHGSGIQAHHLSKIFEPFFTTKDIGKGTGLGLSITYGIVKMHRGDIQVTSNMEPSKGPTGSTFVIILPKNSINGDHS